MIAREALSARHVRHRTDWKRAARYKHIGIHAIDRIAIHIGDLEIAGVDRWADSAVILRCRMKPLAVRRAYLKLFKEAFDSNGIEIPFHRVTVFAGQLRTGAAASFHLQSPSDTEIMSSRTTG